MWVLAALLIVFFISASKTVRAVISGYKLNIVFAIERLELFCLVLNEDGSINKVSRTKKYFKDLSCSRHICCGYKADMRTYCFRTHSFTCGTTMLNALAIVSMKLTASRGRAVLRPGSH